MSKNWYVVYTTPRAERKTYQRLVDKQIEAFFPEYTTLRQWSDRKKRVTVPLFNSYLFLHLDLAKEKYEVLDTFGVVRFVHYLGQPAVVRDEEIEGIRFMLANYNQIETEALEPGSRVTLTSGAFKGQSGIVEDVRSGTVTLILESVGYRITARIGGDGSKLEV
jgi:transcriptional antiterminator RfaH